MLQYNNNNALNKKWNRAYVLVFAYERALAKENLKPLFHFKKCPCPLTIDCPLLGMCKYRVSLGGKKGN